MKIEQDGSTVGRLRGLVRYLDRVSVSDDAVVTGVKMRSGEVLLAVEVDLDAAAEATQAAGEDAEE